MTGRHRDTLSFHFQQLGNIKAFVTHR